MTKVYYLSPREPNTPDMCMNHANRARDRKCSFLNDLLNQATAGNGIGHSLIAHIRSALFIGKQVGLQLL